MKIAPIPDDEDRRLAALRATGLLDTAPEQSFDDFTRLAAAICGTPIALISLVDEQRQWFKAKVGLDAPETPRDPAFCAHAILEVEPMVVEDAQRDERFVDNPLVTGGPGVRFYAGVPLRTAEGHALGTLCVIDREPRTLKSETMELLKLLGRQVAIQCELRSAMDDLAGANQELLDLQHGQEDFIASICHDLRSPLASVAGIVDLLESDDTIAGKQRLEFLRHISSNTQHSLRLASNLIDAGRFAGGEVVPEAAPTSLGPLLHALGQRLAVTASLQEARLEWKLESDLPTLELDAGMIERVVINLVANAIAHSPPDGLVSLRAERHGQTVRVAVQDQGGGVPIEERPRLFRRYAQLSGMKQGGAGLGLYIVRTLVEAHGGDVGYESPEEGGARFFFTLPSAG